MKTIVIIENEAVELAALVGLFEQWQKELNVLTAREEKAAISIMSQQKVDLLVCDLALPGNKPLEGLSLLTHTFPYVPCIALSANHHPAPAEALKRGASHCLEKPISVEELLQHAAALLDTDTSGTIKGIPIHSFLQMLESEEKTCTVQVNHRHDQGLLYMQNGELISAETKTFIGEEAAHLILGWQEPVVQLRFYNGQRKRLIHKPLLSVIMEAFRLRDERQAAQEVAPEKEHQLPLKHLSTLGRRLPLDIGSRVKLEFPQLDSRNESTVVGMLQDNYLILTAPQPLTEVTEKIEQERRVLLKYVHRGRVWMFKTQLLKVIESPFQLLFFDYPVVVHYHELRQAKRSSIFIPCTFHPPGAPELFGTLIDLSTSGALCQIRHKEDTVVPSIALSDSIHLRCLMPGIREEQLFPGIVRNLTKEPQLTRIGIEFHNLQPHLVDTIGNYLYAVEGDHD